MIKWGCDRATMMSQRYCGALTNDADREWRDAASDPEQYGTPKSSQDIESQRVHAHHFVNGVPAIPSRLQLPSTGQASKAHLQDTAAASIAGGSDGSAQDGNQPGTAELSAGGLPRPRRHRGKRALPVPDLDAIEDPAKMKLQRQLLKNRRTAAASRERKQREMESLVAKVQALQAVNKELNSILKQRNAEILTLSMELPAKQKLSPPAAILALGFRGNAPLHGSFSAWPGSHGQPRHMPGSPGCLPGLPRPEVGQRQSRGGAAWNAVARSLSLPDGGPAAAAGCAEASLLNQPLSMPPLETVSVKILSLPSSNLSSAEGNIAWSHGQLVSGQSAEAETGFFRDLNCHSLHLSSVSTQPLPTEGLPLTCPVGQLDGQLLQGRAFSCPIPRGPKVEPAGETCPSGQLLQPLFGSYPLHRRQIAAHVNGQPLHVAPVFQDVLSPADPAGLDQMDFASFLHNFD